MLRFTGRGEAAVRIWADSVRELMDARDSLYRFATLTAPPSFYPDKKLMAGFTFSDTLHMHGCIQTA